MPYEKGEGTWHIQPGEKVDLEETQQQLSNMYEEVINMTAPGSSHWRVVEGQNMTAISWNKRVSDWI